MRAEFHRADAPEVAVGAAEWSGGLVEVDADDDEVREAIRRIFRATPVAVDDPALRTAGTSGPVVLQPGSLRWFRAVAERRAAAEGLSARLVPEGTKAMGWDPAGAYRTFSAADERRTLLGSRRRVLVPQAGQFRPVGERGPSEPGTEAAKPAPRPSAAGPRRPS